MNIFTVAIFYGKSYGWPQKIFEVLYVTYFVRRLLSKQEAILFVDLYLMMICAYLGFIIIAT